MSIYLSIQLWIKYLLGEEVEGTPLAIAFGHWWEKCKIVGACTFLQHSPFNRSTIVRNQSSRYVAALFNSAQEKIVKNAQKLSKSEKQKEKHLSESWCLSVLNWRQIDFESALRDVTIASADAAMFLICLIYRRYSTDVHVKKFDWNLIISFQ